MAPDQVSEEGRISERVRISNLRGQSFDDAYSKHDVGAALMRERLAGAGFEVFNHGHDFRDHEDIYSGTGIDFGIRYGQTVVGYLDIKAKSSEEWLGRCNLTDWEEYRGFAAYHAPIPVCLCFVHVTDVESATVEDAYLVQVPPSNVENVAEELPFTSKGHRVVEIPDEYRKEWPWLYYVCYEALKERSP